jgi:hypothetical protein
MQVVGTYLFLDADDCGNQQNCKKQMDFDDK